MSDDTHTKLKTSYGNNLGGINGLGALKTAIRICYGVDEMELPEGLSSSEESKILEDSREPADNLARVIHAYVDNMLDDSTSSSAGGEGFTEEEMAALLEAMSDLELMTLE